LRARGLLEDVDHAPRTKKSDRKIDQIYPYLGPDGQLRFQVVRYHPKGFSQRRPNGKDGWISNLNSVVRVPYRLPELLASGSEPVFVVEGEKDVDNLFEIGLIATCGPGGAGRWRDEYKSFFRGKRVIILPDNDVAGREHSQAVATSLEDVADQIKVIELPGLRAKGDVSDWLEDGGTRSEFLRIVDEAPAWKPDSGNWYAEVVTGARGQVLCNHANTMLALRRDPEWQGVFGYDTLRGQVMLLRPVPRTGRSPEADFGRPVPWTDENDSQAQEFLQLSGFPNVNKSVVSAAISQRAIEVPYNSVQDYLNGLEWDGIPRLRGGPSDCGDILEPFFVAYFGADDTPFVQAVGTMFLVSAVARIMDPGCKVDHVPILEGPQGIGKSSSLRVLTGETFFSDGLPEIGSKDAADHLRGKWLIEFAELDAMTRAEDAALKAFITRQVDKYRPAYGRREIEWRRQCVFVGTTNKSVYLKDETGGRRYWPIRCTSIDLAAIERDRDQLLAEAVSLYRQGQPWHISDPKIARQAREEQQQRYDADVWEERISDFIAGKELVTVSEVMKDALRIETPRQRRADQNRVMNVLSSLGWVRSGRVAGGRTAWVPQGLAE